MQVVLIWLFVSGCAGAVWIAGYHMGYRRGANDAISGSVHKARRSA